MSFKQILKRMLPPAVIQFRRRLIDNVNNSRNSGKTRQEIFSEIYSYKTWGSSNGELNFYSGIGSHDNRIVEPYIQACSTFLGSFEPKLLVVDLGCGDFNVGSKLVPFSKDFIACDVVEELISFNRSRFSHLPVSFHVKDFCKDELPSGDVAFVREVLQHLSNESISSFLNEAKRKYTYLIVTEHLPSGTNFIPNKNKRTGHNIRLLSNSGVVLTKPPFNLDCKYEKTLVSIPLENGVMKTVLYEL